MDQAQKQQSRQPQAKSPVPGRYSPAPLEPVVEDGAHVKIQDTVVAANAQHPALISSIPQSKKSYQYFKDHNSISSTSQHLKESYNSRPYDRELTQNSFSIGKMSRFSPITKLSQSAGGKRGDASVVTTRSFISTLNGFSSIHSANSLRNSVTPIRFAKSERFPKIRSDTTNVDFHQPQLKDLDQSWHSHKRGYSLGFGDKQSFEATDKNPGPGNYSVRSEFDIPKDSKKCSFGFSYEEIQKRADFWTTVHNVDFKQSCTKYSPYKDLGTDRLKFSLKGRLEPLAKMKIPGPADYSVEQKLVTSGRYNDIGFGYGDRPNLKEIKLSPGPGDYRLPQFTDRYSPRLLKIKKRKLSPINDPFKSPYAIPAQKLKMNMKQQKSGSGLNMSMG